MADASASALSVLNAGSGQLTSTIPLASAPFGVAFGPLPVGDQPRDNSITRVDPGSRQPGQQIAVGSGPTAITYGAGSVWVANGLDSTVSRVDPVTDRVAAIIPVGDGPDAVAVAGGSVWAAGRLSSALTRISAGSDAAAATIGVGGGPVALAADGGDVWVAAGAGRAGRLGGRCG